MFCFFHNIIYINEVVASVCLIVCLYSRNSKNMQRIGLKRAMLVMNPRDVGQWKTHLPTARSVGKWNQLVNENDYHLSWYMISSFEIFDLYCILPQISCTNIDGNHFHLPTLTDLAIGKWVFPWPMSQGFITNIAL